MKRAETRRRMQAVGGFETNDLTIDFYERVRAILPDQASILDFGAGRGQWLEDPSPRRRAIRDLRDVAGRLVGADVDPVVKSNPSLDEAFVIEPGEALPLDDGWADVMVADWVIEHIDDPAWFVGECTRVVKPGGWVCGRTPAKAGYIAVGARLVPNRRHFGVLRRLQPTRKDEDVFPTRYRLNSLAAISAAFGDEWEDLTFPVWPNLDYGGSSVVLERAQRLWKATAPDRLAPVLWVFLRRR